MELYHMGIDVGGSKLLGIVADENYTILHRKKQTLTNISTIDELIDSIVNLYEELKGEIPKEAKFTIGFALPSSIDPQKGIAKSLTAFGWLNIPIGKMIKDRIKIDIKMGNDGDLAALAEYHLGAGRGTKSMYLIIPGTGLGGGYICDGKPVHGRNYTAGEIGHMVIQIDGPTCRCGQKGCLEAFVSNFGFRQMFEEAMSAGKTSTLSLENKFDSETVVNAWMQGDEVVKSILILQARALGIGIANIINTTGVERIIIGGNYFRQLEDTLFPVIEKYAERHAIGGGMKDVSVVMNELGTTAVALGAAFLGAQA